MMEHDRNANMIKNFLIERRSWILLFIGLQGLLIFVAYLDDAIPLGPIFYIVFLSLIIFSFFLFIRYHKETKFYRSLSEWDNTLDLTSLSHAERPFEKIIETTITNQTIRLKQDTSKSQIALEEEKDDLLAWIHEVKTPLTSMHLMIESMNDVTMKNKLTVEWLRIHHLLDQQLHQKRLPFMENDLYIEKVDLKAVVFKEIKDLQSWCIQKKIGFDVDLEEESVLSDGKWLAFIIRQMLTNAVKYSDASDILIKSYTQDDQTKLIIEDSGRGIDHKDLPRIFDKGFTSTTSHQDQSATGMGLFLAKKAAKPLLIKIDVSSTLGKGTVFTLLFPKRNDFTRITRM
jgi:OmpR family two-component system bacitracin resistance sensor histidine kinase BceS